MLAKKRKDVIILELMMFVSGDGNVCWVFVWMKNLLRQLMVLVATLIDITPVKWKSIFVTDDICAHVL